MNHSEVLCPSCGEAVRSGAKFCGACGATINATESTLPGESQPPPVPRSESGNSATSTKESATEFAEILKGYAGLPGVRLASLASLVGFGLVLVFGFLIAVLLPDSSSLSYDDDGTVGLFKEVMFQVAGTSLSGIELSGDGESLSFHPAPIFFFLVPFVGVALGVALQLKQGGFRDRKSTLIAAISSAIPFAILMSIAALLTSQEEDQFTLSASVSGTFLLSLIAGGLGGLTGALLAQRDEAREDGIWPAKLEKNIGLVWALLKPLGILLVAASLVGATIWSVQSIRNVAEVRGDSSLLTSVIDNVAFGGDFGIRNVGLGTMSTLEVQGFDEASVTPIPVDPSGDKLSELTKDGKFNLLDYKNVLKAWSFVPILVVLIAMPLVLALYSGFLIGRDRQAPDPKLRAAWGALVGPVWAIVMVVLNALSMDMAFGHVIGDSLFVMVLIVGSIVGAVGSLLGTQAIGAPTTQGGGNE